MDLIKLKYFVTMANCGSMQQAAKALNVSQSTISVAIKNLEQELGVTLFRREGRRLVLTEAGRVLQDGAADLLAQAETLRQQLLFYQSGHEDRLCIETEVPDFTTNAEIICRHLYPAYKVIQHRPSCHALRSLLQSGQTDFAVTLTDLTDSSVESFHILDEPVLLMVNDAHPASGQQRIDLSSLGAQTLISLPGDYSFRYICDHIFALAGIRIHAVHEVFDPESIPVAVSKGNGVGIIPRSTYLKNRIHLSRQVHAVALNDAFCVRSVYLSRVRKKTFSPAAKNLWNLMIRIGEWVKEHETYPAPEDLCI